LNSSAKHLIKVLKAKGFVFKRSKGSHHIYYNPDSNKTVIVPYHGNKSMPIGTFLAILKQAGIDKSEL
jgi:predicted RNA binding protein YcfA (HicA-like mRNA interferase family)